MSQWLIYLVEEVCSIRSEWEIDVYSHCLHLVHWPFPHDCLEIYSFLYRWCMFSVYCASAMPKHRTISIVCCWTSPLDQWNLHYHTSLAAKKCFEPTWDTHSIDECRRTCAMSVYGSNSLFLCHTHTHTTPLRSSHCAWPAELIGISCFFSSSLLSRVGYFLLLSLSCSLALE